MYEQIIQVENISFFFHEEWGFVLILIYLSGVVSEWGFCLIGFGLSGVLPSAVLPHLCYIVYTIWQCLCKCVMNHLVRGLLY